MIKKLNPEELIKQIESLLVELRNSLSQTSRTSTLNAAISTGKEKKEFSGLTAKVYELVEEGFFDEQKTIADLQRKLKDRGANKPTTSLMAPLKLLIDKKVLDRSKPGKGIYNYFKR